MASNFIQKITDNKLMNLLDTNMAEVFSKAASKTIFILAALAFVCFVLGYWTGVDSKKNPIGDGEVFYVEVTPTIRKGTATTLIYHSTLKCTRIKYGIKPGEWEYGVTYASNNNLYPFCFCSQCMTDQLIENCSNRIRDAYNAKHTPK
jgi:hypothetical protein